MICCQAPADYRVQNQALAMYSRFRCCSRTTRRGSKNQKWMAIPAKTTSRRISEVQNNSKPENSLGQPCQNGKEAPAVTISQRHASNVKNRVFGRRTTSRTVQLPVSKLSGNDSMGYMLQSFRAGGQPPRQSQPGQSGLPSRRCLNQPAS